MNPQLMKVARGIGLATLALFALLVLAVALAPAGDCHHATATVTYPGWEWWGGGYWHGTYYRAGWYRTVTYHAEHHDHQTYSVSYDPDKAELIRLLDKALDKLPDARPAGEKAAALDGRAVLTSRCLACHAAAVAEAKGNGFAIDPSSVTPNDLKRITARINSTDAAKVMPPGKPLAAGERKAVGAMTLE